MFLISFECYLTSSYIQPDLVLVRHYLFKSCTNAFRSVWKPISSLILCKYAEIKTALHIPEYYVMKNIHDGENDIKKWSQ